MHLFSLLHRKSLLLLLWAELCLSYPITATQKNSNVELLTPSTQECDYIVRHSFREVIKLK